MFFFHSADVSDSPFCCLCCFKRGNLRWGSLQQLYRSSGQATSEHLQVYMLFFSFKYDLLLAANVSLCITFTFIPIFSAICVIFVYRHCIIQAKIPGCYWNSWLGYITGPFHIWGEFFSLLHFCYLSSTLPLLFLFGVISVAEMMLKLIYNLFLSTCAFRVGHWYCALCFLFSGFVAKGYKFCPFEASKLPFSATCIDVKFYF